MRSPAADRSQLLETHLRQKRAVTVALAALSVVFATALLLGNSGCPNRPRPSFSSGAVTPNASVARKGCDLTASSAGPIRTPGQLVKMLRPGQVGCLRAGVYSTDHEVSVSTPDVTLESYPGERATWDGRIVILAANVTIEYLNLDGALGPLLNEPQDPQCQAVGGCTLPSLSVNGPGARIYHNDVTNRRGICVNTGSYGLSTPNGFDIEANRIHDCKPANNHIHGIYISDGAGGLIKDNAIFDNGDRGIQLYPNARDTTVEYNTVDGNRTNILLGGNASDNTIEKNIFSFPSTSQADPAGRLGARFNVEANLLAPSDRGNIVSGNCTYTLASGYFGGTFPHSGIAAGQGFVASNNVVETPKYLNRGEQDFTLADGSGCVGFGASPDVTTP